MIRGIATIARYALVEALRSGLPWLAAGCVLAVLALAAFLARVAITESIQLQAAFGAALLRACAVFLVAAHVVASITREANDKGLELFFALPLPRPAWYLGKLAGHAGLGVLVAALFALPLLAWSAAADVAAWWLSLSAELALVAAAALFFAAAMSHPVAAIGATAALYVLGRAIPAIQAIASGPHAGDSAGAAAARGAVDLVALVLPRLDAATQGEWLLYGAPPAGELAFTIGGLLVYVTLLAAAGLFDLSRRNL